MPRVKEKSEKRINGSQPKPPIPPIKIGGQTTGLFNENVNDFAKHKDNVRGERK